MLLFGLAYMTKRYSLDQIFLNKYIMMTSVLLNDIYSETKVNHNIVLNSTGGGSKACYFSIDACCYACL